MRRIRLSPLAASEIEAILERSEIVFGAAARLRYEALLETALRDIAAEPERPGVRRRDELGPGMRTYHLLYNREKARMSGGIVHRPPHFLLFRLTGTSFLDVGHVLHEAMDTSSNLPTGLTLDPPDDEDEGW